MLLILKKRYILYIFCLGAILFFGLSESKELLASELNAYKGTEVPVILSRSSWENNAQLKNILKINFVSPETASKKRPSNYPISRIIIHDTSCQVYLPNGSRNANCNSYKQNSIALIQNIYRYHVLNKKYQDIGYNFIIGWDGKIFEGRYGGNTIVGDHYYDENNCQDYNVGSIGILLLANLETEGPSQEINQSLERLIAWLSMGNSLDISTLKKDNFVWQYDSQTNLDRSHSCDFNNGNIIPISRGPALVYYQSLGSYTNYHLNVRNLRENSTKLTKYFAEYLYKGDSANVWKIQKGYRKEGLKIGARVITIDNNQLKYFPKEQIFKIDDNDLIKLYDRDNIYLVKSGVLREILSRQIFQARGFKNSKIKEVDFHTIKDYTIGQPLSYSPRTLVKVLNDDKIYLVNEGGALSHVSSLELFKKLGFQWENILIISIREKEMLPEKEPILFPTGSLVKAIGKTVYLVTSRMLRPIRRRSIFNAYNFDWDDVVLLPNKDLQFYSRGLPLTYPDNVLLTSPDNNKIYLIKNGRRHLIKNRALITILEKEKVSLINIPHEELVKYPLGINLEGKEDIIQFDKLVSSITTDYLEIGKGDNNFQISCQSYPGEPESSSFFPIRIGLDKLESDSQLTISASEDYNISQFGKPIIEKEAGSSYIVKVKDINNKIRFSSRKGNVIFSINSAQGSETAKKALARYRGAIEIIKEKSNNKPDEYWLINELFLKDYLYGVYFKGSDEMLPELRKALAVANRSYAWYYINTKGRYKNKSFHLMKEEGNLKYGGYNFELSQSIEALEDTKGEALIYKGTPACVVYSLDTCGISRDARILWGSFYKKFPYLWGDIKDPRGTLHQDNCRDKGDHGIGMSIAGATTFASQGKSYFDILQYYYPGVRIDEVY